jgi:hypothetical protein
MTDTKSPANIADQAAEAIRMLNHQLLGSDLQYPSDAYDVIGNLRILADRLPQALGLIGSFLQQQHERGAIRGDSSADPGPYVAAAVDALRRAREDAEVMTEALDVAHEASSGLKAPR